MDLKRWDAVEALLDKALDAGPERWTEVVTAGSAGDEVLRAEVMALLAHHPRLDGFLSKGAAGVVDGLGPAERSFEAGTTIGPWRIAGELGRGGMSRVYRGERADGAFDQAVAIKILRAGLDSAIDVDRFRRERQILAALEHPNIARLLDGGSTVDQRPYLVLELVDGDPIHDWCAAGGLSTQDRVRLGVTVARAVAFAHRHLVVHRDLKPSNILVTRAGVPKLLDFGIAKLLDADGGGHDTATRHRWLSPGYAAPEQVRGEATSTATDVYQLGVVLYEMLTGRLPILAGEEPYELAVLRREPIRPSSVVPELAGDLDAILLKALRSAPRDRYQSADELADDLERIGRREPVQARTGERAYRLRRFLARRAGAVAATSALVVAAVGYMVTVQRQNERISAALAESDRQREKSDRVTDFLVTLFRSQDPSDGAADSVSARTLLARGETLAGDNTRNPDVQWAMLQVLGRIREDLGATETARANYARALELATRAGRSSEAELASLTAQLAGAHYELRHLDTAETLYRRALALRRRSLGDTAVETRGTMLRLGTTLHALQRGPAADTFFTEWERLMRAKPEVADTRLAGQLASMADHLGWLSTDTVQLARAEAYARESLRMYRALYGERNTHVADAIEQVGVMVGRAGRTEEAIRLTTEAAAQLTALYPAGHPRLASTLMSLGTLNRDAGRDSAALTHYQRGFEMTLRLQPDDAFLIAGGRQLYGDALRRAGRHDEAIRELKQSEAEFTARVSAGSVLPRHVRVDLGIAYQAARRYPEAERALRSAYEEMRERRTPRDRYVRRALQRLVALYEEMGRSADAAKYRAVLAEASTADLPKQAMTAPMGQVPR